MKSIVPELPITPFLSDIETALRQKSWLLLEAAPGAGKSTLVPFHLSQNTDWNILVVQPRRLAATLTAQYVSSLTGVNLGERIGYHVRYDKKDSTTCRVLFVTEGMLMRYALEDPTLRRWHCIILDEFHERHLHTDVAFALLKQLQRETRAELKVCIMSATLHGSQLQQAVPEAQYLQVPGRTFPVTLSYATRNPQDQPLDLLPGILQNVLQEKNHGNILVFLPGTREIQLAEERITPLLQNTGINCLQLTSQSSQQATKQLFGNTAQRFVILATNVAETSVTLPHITHVFDSGLAKIAQFDAANRFNLLQTRRVSQDSCIQRMGRAGRTGPGTCIRLFPEQDYLNRPARIEPEFLRLDLTQTLLEVHTLYPNATDIESALPWLEKPPEDKVTASLELLSMLRLLQNNKITALGKAAAQLPFHPRLSTFLVLLQQQKVPQELALLLTCLLEQQGIAKHQALPPVHETSDVIYQLHLLLKWFCKEPLAPVEHRYIAPEKVQAIQYDLSRLLSSKRASWGTELSEDLQKIIEQTLLATFSDRVGRSIKKAQSRGEVSFALCQGNSARLSRTSVCQDEELLLALILQSVTDNVDYQITLASQVDRKAVLQDNWPLYRESIVDTISAQGQKQSLRQQYYGQLLLAEEKIQAKAAPASSSELAAILKQTNLSGFPDAEALTRYHMRRSLLIKNHCISEDDFPEFSGEMLELFLEACCEGYRNLDELYRYGLEPLIHDQLGYQAAQLLIQETPLKFTFPNKRHTTINYEPDKDPWIGDRIQNFFGLSGTPHICQGRQVLTVQLFAPSMRPVQITKDLAGFWKNTYPTVKQELQRRYPRHKWPENPVLLPAPT